jgi:hypothetical protein
MFLQGEGVWAQQLLVGNQIDRRLNGTVVGFLDRFGDLVLTRKLLAYMAHGVKKRFFFGLQSRSGVSLGKPPNVRGVRDGRGGLFRSRSVSSGA